MGMIQCLDGLFNPLDPFIVTRYLLIQPGMFFQVMLDLTFDLVALGFKFLKRAGPFLGGVRRHLATVDGEQLISQEALFMTNQ